MKRENREGIAEYLVGFRIADEEDLEGVLEDDPPVLPLVRTRLQYLDVVFADGGHYYRYGERNFGGAGLLTSEEEKRSTSAASSPVSHKERGRHSLSYSLM
ncbi:hypothetical protein SLE2022_136520 [Rubroshorea leprosula]